MFAKTSTKILSALMGLTASISLVACGSTAGTDVRTAANANTSVVSTGHGASDIAVVMKENAQVHSAELDYDASSAKTIELTGSGTEITSAGVYRLTGSVSDGQINVNSADSGTVYLILDGVDVTSTTTAALTIADAGDVVIILADGSTNTLTDASSYTTGEDGPSGTLYSTADLTITGSGSLNINGNYNDGIVSKDGLVIDSGTITVKASDDGIGGKDYLVVNNGTLNVSAGGDAMKSDNTEDVTMGFVAINGGTITLTAGDDGINGYTDTLIAGGTTTVSATGDGIKSDIALVVGGGTTTVTKSTEAVESNTIAISEGKLDLTSTDDAINASVSDTSTTSPTLKISGGTTTINSEGDGIDVNGAFDMTGGVVTIHGPVSDGNGAMDVDSAFIISGGTLLAGGSAGMMMAPEISSPQGWVAATSPVSSGQSLEIKDSAGTVLASYRAEKQIASLIVSTAGMVNGSTYDVYLDGSKISSITAGQGGEGGPGGGRGPRR